MAAPFFVKKNTLGYINICSVANFSENYTIIQGDTFVAVDTITDNNGDAVDLTGATIVTTVVDRNGTDLAEITTSSHTTPVSGITTITIPAATTANFPMGVYDLQSVVTLSDSRVFGLEVSTINVVYAI